MTFRAHISLHMDQFELAVSTDIVQLGNPIVAFIRGLVARRCLSVGRSVWAHGTLEGCPASDDMDVTGGNAWTDDGI